MFEKLFGKKEEKTAEVNTDSGLTSEIKMQPVKQGDAVQIQTSSPNATCESPDVVPQPVESKVDSPKEEAQEIPPLTFKEMRALKRSRYEDTIMNNPYFKKSYVLLNIRTGQMAEIRAASSFHACNIIGWKVRHVLLVMEKDITEKEPETTGSSSNAG